MIFFCIPLRSKASSKNWDEVQLLFGRTLHSIPHQDCEEWECIIACHDIPDVKGLGDSRIRLMQMDSPLPTSYSEQMLDKGWKVQSMAMHVRNRGGGHTMLVDSDDLISRRVAAHAARNPSINGFIGKMGYIWNEGSPRVKVIRKPWNICGSCTVVNWRPEELPDHMPKNFYDQSDDQARYVIRKSHNVIPRLMEEAGRPLEVVDFPTTIYVQNTGDNHSINSGTGFRAVLKKLRREIRISIPMDERISREFGLQK